MGTSVMFMISVAVEQSFPVTKINFKKAKFGML